MEEKKRTDNEQKTVEALLGVLEMETEESPQVARRFARDLLNRGHTAETFRSLCEEMGPALLEGYADLRQSDEEGFERLREKLILIQTHNEAPEEDFPPMGLRMPDQEEQRCHPPDLHEEE